VLAIELELFLAFLDDLLLGFGELLWSSGFCGECKFLFLALLIGFSDGFSFLLAALFLLSFNFSKVLLEEILWDWIALDLTWHGLRLRDDLWLRLCQVEGFGLCWGLLWAIVIITSC
jgi:hypothetical protein